MAESRSSSTPPLGSIVLLLLFAAGVYVQQFQLQSARPDSADTKRNRFVGIQDVKARLWQDPFEAVTRHREAAGTSASVALQSDHFHEISFVRGFLSRKVKDNGKGVVILGAMVFGGPYADDAEQRRRQRYAILSGLALHGYEPDDPDNIGFFIAPSEGGIPDVVPFEWLQHEGGDKGVLLLWLEEDAYAASAARPLVKLQGLLESLDPQPAGKPLPPNERLPLKLLGPASSGGLGRLGHDLQGAEKLEDPLRIIGRPIEIYSATATAGNDYIPGLKGITESRNIPLLRTTSTDDQLAAAIRKELDLRGAKGMCDAENTYRDYVVLVSEWDTDYGKRLPEQVEHALGCSGNNAAVVRVSYLRGLDGKTAGTTARTDKDEPRPDDDRNRSGKINPERADGNSQTDYVRRLASDLRDLDARLRASKRGRIRAVGVLGSDFYDKLIVLQALRPEFPEALFFTTDLDARYLSSEQYRWTRNLIVASSFGLQLAPGLQGRTPPFRDTYQTASFLATRLAFDPVLEGRLPDKKALVKQWTAAPRVFEIGRTAAFDLTVPAGAPVLPVHCTGTLDKCTDVHLQRPAVRLTDWEKTLLTIAIFTFVAALAAYSRSVRELVGRRETFLGLLLILGLAIWGFAFLVQILTQSGAGEPFAWLEGISIWPTVFIRIVAALLCLYFIGRAIRRFAATGKVLVTEFRLRRIRAAPGSAKPGTGNAPWYRQRAWIDAYLWPPPRHGRKGPVDVLELWGQYRDRSSCSRRCRRVAPVAAMFLFFGFATIQFFGRPLAPCRGDFSCTVDFWSIIAVIFLFVFLLFLVVDATMLCRTFIRYLQKVGSNWPGATVTMFERETGIPDCADRNRGHRVGMLSDWIDVRYIARYTQEVSELIWYPFIVIALLVAARSSLFDNWPLPPGLALVILACVTYAVACAVLLQFTAASARETALSNMREKLVWAKGSAPELAEQIDTLMTSIANLRQGAFRPVTEQPLVRAVLVTLSSYGGISIAEYLALLPR